MLNDPSQNLTSNEIWSFARSLGIKMDPKNLKRGNVEYYIYKKIIIEQ